jgi:hypothetical protein
MNLRWALLLIAATAVLVWSPSLLVAAPGDSFSYTLNWSRQFTQQFLAGNLYPRWTASSFGGLGAPTFYFYPPLPFWVTAAISGPTAALLTATQQLKLAELVFLALSGLTMFAWLRTRAGVVMSLVGAVLFMVAPYHMDDHYIRGAFAEFAAFVFLPIVGLGLAWIAKEQRLGVVTLAFGWACLVLCHLPTALLAAVLLVAPYGGFLAWEARGRRVAVATWMALGMGAGACLAAIYLIPSLTLQGAISSEYWWSAQFQVGGRLFANPAAWKRPLEPYFGFFSLGEAVVACVIGWRARRYPDREVMFWAAAVAGLFLVMAGLVPGFWSLPFMAKVQFPWRAMALQDFAFVTLFAWAEPVGRTPMISIVFAALISSNAIAVAHDLASGPPVSRQPGYGVTSFPTDADAPEYLPEGMLKMTPDGPAPAVAYAPLVAGDLVTGPVTRAAGNPVTGAVRMEMAGRAGQVVVRRFYFPAWVVRCDGVATPTFAVSGARLLGFRAPAAARVCEAAIGVTPAEKLGAVLALLGLGLLGGYAAWLVGGRRTGAKATGSASA